VTRRDTSATPCHGKGPHFLPTIPSSFDSLKFRFPQFALTAAEKAL
jgi:hypothetical protein